MPTTTSRNETSRAKETINLRASAEQKSLIDRAAARLGKTRTEFMLDSAREAAENTILDQRLFLVDDDQYTEFIAALDEPIELTDALKKTLAIPPPWKP